MTNEAVGATPMQNDKLVEALDGACNGLVDEVAGMIGASAEQRLALSYAEAEMRNRLASLDLSAALSRSDDGAGVLPCDVRLPPATTIRAGCSFETLRSALSTEGRPVHFYDAHPPAAVAGEGAKYAEMPADEKAVAMADDCVGDPWELLGYFRTKLENPHAE